MYGLNVRSEMCGMGQRGESDSHRQAALDNRWGMVVVRGEGHARGKSILSSPFEKDTSLQQHGGAHQAWRADKQRHFFVEGRARACLFVDIALAPAFR